MPARNYQWYVFKSYINYHYRAYNFYTGSVSCCSCTSTSSPSPTLNPNKYNYYYTTPNLNVTLLDLSTNAVGTTLRLHLIITPNSTISMTRSPGYTAGRYPRFRFYVNNYKFTCTSYQKFMVTYSRPSSSYVNSVDHRTNTGMLSCSDSELSIMYYYLPYNQTFGDIWGGNEGTSIDPS